MQSHKKYPAIIKLGANSGRLVYIQRFDEGSGKFLIDWPDSSAIGYYMAVDLHPAGDWHFGKDNVLVDGVLQPKQFANGDPFELIKSAHSRTEYPILIQLTSGKVTIGYPHKGHIAADGLYFSGQYTDRLFIISDRYFEDDAIITPAGHGSPNVVHENNVVAWSYMPNLQ